MLKRYVLMTTLLTGVLMSATLAHAQADTKKEVKLKGIKCMLCGMQVNEESVIDYKGAKLYFGCAACPAAFRKAPAKYAAKANAQLVATKQARQKACPVMGKPYQKEIKLTMGGTDVMFCCPKCKTAVAKLEADAKIDRLFNDKAFKKAFEIPKPTNKGVAAKG